MIGELKVEVMEDDWFRDGGIEMVLCDGGNGGLGGEVSELTRVRRSTMIVAW